MIRGQGPGFRVQGVAGKRGPGETVPPFGVFNQDMGNTLAQDMGKAGCLPSQEIGRERRKFSAMKHWVI